MKETFGERRVGLGSRGGINQQAGLIRPGTAGFLSPQQASEADKASPLSSSSTEGKKEHKTQRKNKVLASGFQESKLTVGHVM